MTHGTGTCKGGKIIPYQELLGNYDFQIIDNTLRCIIPYQHNMRGIYHKFSATGTIDAKEIKRSFASFLYMEL